MVLLDVREIIQNIYYYISKFIHSLQISITIDHKGPSILLESLNNRPEEDIIAALQGLDALAVHEKKRVVLLFDEFQQLATLSETKTLEAAIRHVAQHTKKSSYIFSGSNRHLLSNIFDDSSRPLYHLCDRIILGRIHNVDYQKFINKAAQSRWKIHLDDNTISKNTTDDRTTSLLCQSTML